MNYNQRNLQIQRSILLHFYNDFLLNHKKMDNSKIYNYILDRQMNRQEANNERIILNDNPNVGQSSMFPNVISKSSSPGVAAIHIILKIVIVAIYLLMPLLFPSSTNYLMVVVILGAVDFWIVKNLAGRLLVGLRWWIDFDENGQQSWKFECKVDEKAIGAASQKAFWWTLYLFVLIWLLLGVINVLKINITQVTICAYVLVLLFYNLYSYYKCSKVQSQNVQKLIGQYGSAAAAKFMGGSIIAGFK